MIEEMDIDKIIDGFMPSSPTTDPEIAFDQCKTIAFEFMIHAANQGFRPRWFSWLDTRGI